MNLNEPSNVVNVSKISVEVPEEPDVVNPCKAKKSKKRKAAKASKAQKGTKKHKTTGGPNSADVSTVTNMIDALSVSKITFVPEAPSLPKTTVAFNEQNVPKTLNAFNEPKPSNAYKFLDEPQSPNALPKVSFVPITQSVSKTREVPTATGFPRVSFDSETLNVPKTTTAFNASTAFEAFEVLAKKHDMKYISNAPKVTTMPKTPNVSGALNIPQVNTAHKKENLPKDSSDGNAKNSPNTSMFLPKSPYAPVLLPSTSFRISSAKKDDKEMSDIQNFAIKGKPKEKPLSQKALAQIALSEQVTTAKCTRARIMNAKPPPIAELLQKIHANRAGTQKPIPSDTPNIRSNIPKPSPNLTDLMSPFHPTKPDNPRPSPNLKNYVIKNKVTSNQKRSEIPSMNPNLNPKEDAFPYLKKNVAPKASPIENSNGMVASGPFFTTTSRSIPKKVQERKPLHEVQEIKTKSNFK